METTTNTTIIPSQKDIKEFTGDRSWFYDNLCCTVITEILDNYTLDVNTTSITTIL